MSCSGQLKKAIVALSGQEPPTSCSALTITYQASIYVGYFSGWKKVCLTDPLAVAVPYLTGEMFLAVCLIIFGGP